MKKRVVFTQDYTSLGDAGSGGVAAACYRAGNYVYVTGQTAFTLEGKLVGVGDAAAQARQAMENIKTLMEMAGGIARRRCEARGLRDELHSIAPTAQPDHP